MEFKEPSRRRYANHVPERHRNDTYSEPELRAMPAQVITTEATADAKPKRKGRVKKVSPPRHWKKTIAIIVVCLIIGWLIYGYINTKNQLENLKNGSTSGQSSSQQLTDKVGQLVDLPKNDNPTIATVNDASKLKNQEFFANAKNGDKVLIYSKSGMAVLYRPSTNKVIQYSVVNTGSSSSTNTTAPSTAGQ